MRGRSQKAYPNHLIMLARTGSRNYDKLRRLAANAKAIRAESIVVGIDSRKLLEIERFQVQNYVADGALENYSVALDAATDERAMQEVLERFPEILSVLVPRHHGAWVIPQKWLGSDFRPDFLVAGMDSAGLKWLLVELESPTAALRIKSGEFPSSLRHGIQQIKDWRHWLEDNLSYARSPRSDNGLGLPGIVRNAAGLVLVGRTAGPTTEIDRNRRTAEVEQNIAVHTYDWLQDRARHEHPMKWGALELDTNPVDLLPIGDRNP